MDLSNLQYEPGARRSRSRVGRGPGSGSGKTCGRGHKGQKARSGYSARRGFEGGQMPLYRRVPKRGFNHRKRFPYAPVNVDLLDRTFDEGTVVTPEMIVGAGLASPAQGGIKILGRGEITTKLTVRANEVSSAARQKIEAAGGTVEIIGIPEKEKSSKAPQETK